MVRLITQNLLSCPSRACAYPTNFPLAFRNVQKLEVAEAEFSEEFLRGVLSRIEWAALRKSAAEVSGGSFPSGSLAKVAGAMEAVWEDHRMALLGIVSLAALSGRNDGRGARFGRPATGASDWEPQQACTMSAPAVCSARARYWGLPGPIVQSAGSAAPFCCSSRKNPSLTVLSSCVQLGNTDLPEQSPDLTQPDAISLDLLKTLHHVLLEVRCRLFPPLIS